MAEPTSQCFLALFVFFLFFLFFSLSFLFLLPFLHDYSRLRVCSGPFFFLQNFPLVVVLCGRRQNLFGGTRRAAFSFSWKEREREERNEDILLICDSNICVLTRRGASLYTYIYLSTWLALLDIYIYVYMYCR